MAVLVLAVVLVHDWTKEKKLFRHVDQNKHNSAKKTVVRSEGLTISQKQAGHSENRKHKVTRNIDNSQIIKQIKIPEAFLETQDQISENISPKKKQFQPPMIQTKPKLKPTHTGGYTIIPQRPAPPPPKNLHY